MDKKIIFLITILAIIGFTFSFSVTRTQKLKKDKKISDKTANIYLTSTITSAKLPTVTFSTEIKKVINPTFKLANSYELDSCERWQNVVVTLENISNEQITNIAKKLHQDDFKNYYRLFTSNDEIMLTRDAEWEKQYWSEDCQMGKKTCSDDPPKDLYEWNKKHLVGMVWWRYENTNTDKSNKDYKGYWMIDIYKDNKNTGTYHLEDGYSPQPLPFKELGIHKAVKDWQNILICESLYSGDQLIQLAKNLHNKKPNQHYKFFDDDKYYKEFVNWDSNYPNVTPSKALESWMEVSNIGIINTFAYSAGDKIRWQLYLTAPPSDLNVGGIDLE